MHQVGGVNYVQSGENLANIALFEQRKAEIGARKEENQLKRGLPGGRCSHAIRPRGSMVGSVQIGLTFVKVHLMFSVRTSSPKLSKDLGDAVPSDGEFPLPIDRVFSDLGGDKRRKS
jgi:hypothetical protein